MNIKWIFITFGGLSKLNSKVPIILQEQDIVGGVRSILISLFVDSFVQRKYISFTSIFFLLFEIIILETVISYYWFIYWIKSMNIEVWCKLLCNFLLKRNKLVLHAVSIVIKRPKEGLNLFWSYYVSMILIPSIWFVFFTILRQWVAILIFTHFKIFERIAYVFLKKLFFHLFVILWWFNTVDIFRII